MRRLLLAALLLAACDRDPVADAPDLGPGPSPDGGGVDPACARSSAKAELKRVDLVFMLDRSGSMGDGVNGDPAVKWNPVTEALKTFFADPDSVGVSASLQYFPLSDMCNSSAYYYASVPLQPLPDATRFAQSLDATKPAGQTPTLPALTGAVDYARDQAAADPGVRTAIVLVTDGEPDACMSSVINVSTVAEKAAPEIPTYVIGVGDELPDLTMIAQAGGTGAPTVVSTGDPQQTASDFTHALDEIRGLQLTCAFAIPPPPDGLTIDYQNVNVVYTPGGAAAITLAYSKDCAAGTGWHYDDPQAPTRVELCPQSCDTARADRSGAIDVVYGCATLGGVIF